MLRFSLSRPCLGIEIAPLAVRVAAVKGCGAKLAASFTRTVELPAGVVSESYASPDITDFHHLTSVLRECLKNAPSGARRSALSLPDSLFRVLTLEFDELPDKAVDRERLIRWRLEKAAAFDTADTVVRYQVLGTREKGFTVLSCVAKQTVIDQFEAIVTTLGLEPWAVGPSSFHVHNFYSSYLANKSAVSALAHLSADSFSTIIMDANGAMFYRFKDMKRGSGDDMRGRLMREIDDSLHFFTHMDRSQQSEVHDLYLTGESAVTVGLAEDLRNMTALNVEVLSPASVITSAESIDSELAAALGAGSGL